jgi:hypothetical protein
VLVHRLLRRALFTASILPALASVAAPEDFLEQWRMETELGYTHPQGDLEGTFGGGVDMGWTLGHRAGGVVIEAGVHFGSVRYSAAQLVTAPSCTPSGPGRALCGERSSEQRGSRTAVAIGASLPFSLADDRRTLQIGFGGLVGDLSIQPGGAALGTRNGAGVYLKLAGDLVTIGRTAGAGVLLRGGLTSSHGAAFGAASGHGLSDAWLEANLALRIGAGARRP